MPVSNGYVDYVIEQLESVAPVTSRRMFGALGIYSDGLFFAIVDDDTLYFKVGDANRQEYLDAGMPAFMPGGQSMGYHQVPAEVLEDTALLRGWMARSLEVARSAPSKKRPKRG